MEDQDSLPELISLDDDYYEIGTFCNLNYSFKFDLTKKKVAIARFGGPIAICRDVTQTQFYEVNDLFKDHICFYSNEGLFLNKCKFVYNNKIVAFDFIYDELLVVVLENGFYYLINPFEQDQKDTQRIEEKRFTKSDDDLIIEAKIYKNGLAFFTKNNKFYYMNNVMEGKLSEFPSTGIQSEIQSWEIVPHYDFSSDDDDKFDVYVGNTSQNGGGVICLTEQQSSSQSQIKQQQQQQAMIYYNVNQPLSFDDSITLNLQNIKAISSNRNRQWIALLTHEFIANQEEWTCHMISEDQGIYKKVIVKDINKVYAAESERVIKDVPFTMKSVITTTPTHLTPIPGQGQGSGQNSLGNSQRSQLYTTPRVKINMFWIEDKFVVIEIRNSLFIVGGQSSIQQSIDSDIEIKSPSFACVQEIDGVKIVTENKIIMLRRPPQSYINIFEGSQTPGYLLYNKSQINFEDQNGDPSQNDDILSNQEELNIAVEDCIIAGSYELNIERQQNLLKSASHGRILLQGFQIGENAGAAQDGVREEEEKEYSLTRVCKLLRVAFQINQQQKYTRSITFDQMKYLDENSNILLKIMLRYNYHYIAIEVSKFLRLDIKKEIYVHWACCKIEKSEDDYKIINDIKMQLRDQQDIPFTDIAHKALQMGKPKIVLELLNFEPSIQKRIPILLCMAKTLPNTGDNYYSKALNEALLSKDSNLIYLVIKTIWDIEGENSFDYFSKEEILSAHFQRFLKTELDSQKQQQQYLLLYKFLMKQRQYQKAGFSLLEFAIKQSDYSKKLELIKAVKVEFLKDPNDKFYANMIDEQLKLMNNLDQYLPGSNFSLNQKLNQLLSQNKDLAREKLQSELKVHSKSVSINKLKLLIESPTPKEQEIERFVEEVNKKSETIPYWIIIDQLLKKGMEEVAFDISMKIRDDRSREQQYERIIRQSYGKEKEDLLESMQYKITSKDIVDLIKEFLDKLRARKQPSLYS